MLRLLFALLCITSALSAAHFENMIDLSIKVEDAAYNFRVKSLRFNGVEVPLDESDIFKPRKVMQYKLQPGRYMLNWTTEKSTVRWQDEPIKDHERILVLESGDNLIRITIKGDAISLN
ncbi:MAG: hypothetical protein LLG04_01490 [Parachlamydia sp.]|nr:hypothetical protein [Parachlamydia sp.]